MAVDMNLLSVYLNDHITGATGGVGRLRNMTRNYAGTPLEEPLARLAREMEDERRWLIAQAERLGSGVQKYKMVAAAVGPVTAGPLMARGAGCTRVQAPPITMFVEVVTQRAGAGSLVWRSSGAIRVRVGMSILRVVAWAA